jgi:hypothetical protein
MPIRNRWSRGRVVARPRARLLGSCFAVMACLLACLVTDGRAFAQAGPGRSVIPHLQDRFGLSEPQVRGALGALLVFAREQLPKTEFDDFAQRIPNAARIMQEVKMRGVVTAPLDDLEDYENSLSSLGIGQPLASQIAPAVVEYLGAEGFTHERDILARLVD